MRIRRVRPEELAAVGEVTVAAYAEFSGSNSDGYDRVLRDTGRRDREAEVWVATPDDSEEILGSVTICPAGSPWREVAQEGDGEFRMLGVAPSARGQGVGAALVGHVVDRFRREGVPRIVISTAPAMRPAHHLYESAGFVRAPELDWSPTDTVHLIGYRLDLA